MVWTTERRVYLAIFLGSFSVFFWSAATTGQEVAPVAPKAAEAKALTPVTSADLVEVSRQAWSLARQRLQDHQRRMEATDEYKEYRASLDQVQKLEVSLSARIRAATGKTIQWTTGQLLPLADGAEAKP